MRHTVIALALLGACTDQPDPDPARFDGRWRPGSRCEPVAGGVCSLPTWFGGVFADVVDGRINWTDVPGGPVRAVHVGRVTADDCLSVAAGFDEGMARDAYDLCLGGESLHGEIVWGRDTIGECACDVTMVR
jgi:hypothetical protein